MAQTRNRPRLTEQEIAWIEARAKGESSLEAAKTAGYKNPYSASSRNSRNSTLLALNQAVMAAHGLDLPFFVKLLKEAMAAQKLVKATHLGAISDTMYVEDWDIRLRALQIAVDLAGLKPTEEYKIVNTDDGPKTVMLVPDNFREISEEELLKEMQKRREMQIQGRMIEGGDLTAAPEGEDAQ